MKAKDLEEKSIARQNQEKKQNAAARNHIDVGGVMKKFVNVVFGSTKGNFTKVYTFVSFVEPNLVQGDMVVVDTVNGFSVATVVGLGDESLASSERVFKEVVCKLNVAPYYGRQERLRKAEELKRAMDARVEQLKEQAVYEMLAKDDANLQELLNEYKELSKNE